VVNSQNNRDNKVNALVSTRNLALTIAMVAFLGIGTLPQPADAVLPDTDVTLNFLDTAPPPAQSFTTVKQAIPTADTYVAQNFPSRNYGSSASLAAYGTPTIVSYLKFTVPAVEPGQVLIGATLKIKTATAASDGSRDTLSVYRVDDVSVGIGLRIHWLVVPLRVTVAETRVPLLVFRVNVLVLTACTASLKVTVMFPLRLTLVAPLLGVRAVIVGAVVSGGAAAVVKVQDRVASGLLAASRMAAAPPVRVAAYGVFTAKAADGLSVATRLAAS